MRIKALYDFLNTFEDLELTVDTLHLLNLLILIKVELENGTHNLWTKRTDS